MNSLRALVLFIGLLASPLTWSADLVGQPAPDFTAQNQDGHPVHLAELRGKYVVLYFYPKDDTMTCTKQACKFRDSSQKLTALGAVVFGVSRQDAESHRDFRAKFKLPFDLLMDRDGALGRLMGIDSIPLLRMHSRQTILIGPDGKVLQFYKNVNAEKNVDDVIAAIEASKQGIGAPDGKTSR